MLAYKWGLKTVYYSLINKVGAKLDATGTTQINGGSSNNILPGEPITLYEDEDSCEACKL